MSEHYAALCKAQAEMTKAKTDKTNPHFKSKYADLSSVQDACFPALHKHGFAVIQPSGQDENGPYVETIFLHESGEQLSCRVPILHGVDMQKYGSAMTYARRYGLMTLAGIAPEDDDGNAVSGQKVVAQPKPQPKPKPASDEDLRTLVEYALACEAFEGEIAVFNAWIYGTCKGLEPSALTADQVKRTLAYLKKNPDPGKWLEPFKSELENAKQALVKF